MPVVVVLCGYLWAAQREVETALRESARQRAQVAAEQVAELVGRSVGGLARRADSLATDATLRSYLRSPDPETYAAARTTLEQRAGRSGVIEVWTGSSELALAVGTMPSESGRRDTGPLGGAPRSEGVSALRVEEDAKLFDVVSEVRDETGARLGWVRWSGRVSADEERALGALVGGDALVTLGSPDDAAVRSSAPENASESPPTPDTIGAHALVADAPWAAWVGFPIEEVIAPANAFLRRMAILALLLVLAGITVVFLLGGRLTRPLRELTEAAEDVAAGHYTHHVHARGRDEIGRLGTAFNRMTDRIDLAHRALRESNDQTHFALAAASIAVWRVEMDTGVMSCSGNVRDVHGAGPGDLPRNAAEFLALLHPEDRELVAPLLAGAMPDGETREVQYRSLAADDGSRWVEAKARVREDVARGVRSVLGVSLDVTDRRRLESQFLQAQKMEAVGQLAGGVAHDFNNLLTSILGHGNMILADLDEDDPMREDVLEILRGGDSGARLTRQLLAFSRRQVTQHELILIDEVVANTEKLLRRLIGEHILLVTRFAPELEAVRGDRGQIEQVLVNLAVNARDAMVDGGTLTIATENADLNDAYMREHVGVAPGRYVVLTVSDTGTGMDAATQEHVFEPFFTTKPPEKGTGLGLATVFGIVKQAGGHIWLYSEPGRGTMFKVYLPAAGRMQTAPAERPATEMVGGDESVLVVEDSASVRRVARTVLERLGYRVQLAANGQEALDVISQTGQPDLVLTDVIMPTMTGPELAERLRRLHPGIRILFTSGYSGDALNRRGLEEPGVEFIEKPYSPLTLARKVRALLDAAD